MFEKILLCIIRACFLGLGTLVLNCTQYAKNDIAIFLCVIFCITFYTLGLLLREG